MTAIYNFFNRLSSNTPLQTLWAWITKNPAGLFRSFLIIFITLGFLNPQGYQTMNGIMTFLRRRRRWLFLPSAK